MKKLTKTLIASALLSASAASFAGVSANVGAMSDYWFRGLDQSGDKGNASMMGGLDYESDMGYPNCYNIVANAFQEINEYPQYNYLVLFSSTKIFVNLDASYTNHQ